MINFSCVLHNQYKDIDRITAEGERERERETLPETQTEREKERERDFARDTDGERERERERERDLWLSRFISDSRKEKNDSCQTMDHELTDR